MPLVLYQIPASCPCRTVILTAEHLGIELVKKYVDLKANEQLKPEYIAINPQHTVPALDDDGLILWESRAIAKYLVDKYAPGNPLYPRDTKARALVDQVLDFDLGNIFRCMEDYVITAVMENRVNDPEKVENMNKVLAILEKILEKNPYAAGHHLTLADYSIFTSLSFLDVVYNYSFADFPVTSAYLEKMRNEVPKYKELNEIPLKEFGEALKTWFD